MTITFGGLFSSADGPPEKKREKKVVRCLDEVSELDPEPLAECSDHIHMEQTSAEAVLHAIIPDCDEIGGVVGRLQRERIRTAADLARLDKQDLAELGLGMLERSRVLAWTKEVYKSNDGMLTPEGHLEKPRSASAIFEATASGQPPSNRNRGLNAHFSTDFARGPSAILDRCSSENAFSQTWTNPHYHQHLESLEQQADFWCGLAGSWTPQMAARWRRSIEGVKAEEVRESLLESVFDLSQERIREVYDSMMNGMSDSDAVTQLDTLRWGLEKYGLQLPSNQALQALLERVVVRRSDDDLIQLAEFETIISRLTLAQIVMFLEAEGGGLGNNSANATTKAGLANMPSVSMTVFDYCAKMHFEQHVTDGQIRRFFFGHRPLPDVPSEPSMVRWMHMRGYNLNLLLGLTVKYNLHPLAVEDTIEQAPSKADRYGPHYFTTIEGMGLSVPANESEPVQVSGYHVSVFCAGAPMLDTVITVAQEDKSFAEDWPHYVWDLGSMEHKPGGRQSVRVDKWAEKIVLRLQQPLSRVRERRADFLVYMVLDAVTDELMAVVRAYVARLSWLEGRLGALGAQLPRSSLYEVFLVRRQLHVVSRRVRGITRAVKKFIDDRDIGQGLGAYLQDIVEHLDEVWDDCDRLQGKCGALSDAHDRAVDRERDRRSRMQAEQARKQEMRRAAQADRQNGILFILAAVTTVFAPIQFIAGVYGMNFTDGSKPTIPELLWKRGYIFFWGVVVSYLLLCVIIAVIIYCCLRKPAKGNMGSSRGGDGLASDCCASPTSLDARSEGDIADLMMERLENGQAIGLKTDDVSTYCNGSPSPRTSLRFEHQV